MTPAEKEPFDGSNEAHPGDVAKFFRQNFNTLLGHDEEWRFQIWLDQGDLDEFLDDYDLRGAFQENPDSIGDWPARFRKPNHLLFDTSSRYHDTPSPQGGAYEGGTWSATEDGQLIFSPSAAMLGSTHPANWLEAQMRHDYPAVMLCLPKDCTHE